MGQQMFTGDYYQLRELGNGGFAKTIKVRHAKWDYIRALKIFHQTITDSKDKAYTDFLEECKVLMRLGNGNNPHIVRIYQPQLVDNKAFFEMEFIKGASLTKFVEGNQGFVGTEEVMNLLRDISDALRYCHVDIYEACMDPARDQLRRDPKNGSRYLINEQKRQELIEKYRVYHNDIHPGNIIREEGTGRYVLLDFGLAIEAGKGIQSSRRENGVQEYKAPEKYENHTMLTAGIDIYSFGAVLYFFLTGRPPFPFNPNGNSNATEAAHQLMLAHQNDTPPAIFPLRQAAYAAKYPGKVLMERDYPQWLEEVIMKCLAKKPEDRYADGRELHTHVLACLRRENNGTRIKEQLRKQQEENGLLQSRYKAIGISAQRSIEIEKHINRKLKEQLDQLQARFKQKQEELLRLKRKKRHSLKRMLTVWVRRKWGLYT